MPIELGKLTETSQLTFVFLTQDYFNLVSIVCMEKKIPVQSAMECVFFKLESAIARWFDVRSQIPKSDPKTDENVLRYVEELEYLIR